MVFAKPPFGGPEQVLKYLARYTHRVAISNRRLLSMEDGRVSFEYKDYADGNQVKVMTLAATEFIRRFLLHILPSGFVRIRQFGFLANRARRKKLASCRVLLGVSTPSATACRQQTGKHEGERLPRMRDRPHGPRSARRRSEPAFAALAIGLFMTLQPKGCQSNRSLL